MTKDSVYGNLYIFIIRFMLDLRSEHLLKKWRREVWFVGSNGVLLPNSSYNCALPCIACEIRGDGDENELCR